MSGQRAASRKVLREHLDPSAVIQPRQGCGSQISAKPKKEMEVWGNPARSRQGGRKQGGHERATTGMWTSEARAGARGAPHPQFGKG